MTKYFLITGLDEGLDIEPYIVETWGEQPIEVIAPLYGDHSRYAKEITQREVIEYMKNGVEIWWFNTSYNGGYQLTPINELLKNSRKRIKMKLTKNSMRTDYVFGLGLGAQHLLRYQEKTGHNEGLYGWNYDTYEFYHLPNGSITLNTGYRPYGKKLTSEQIDLMKSLDEKARTITQSDLSYNEMVFEVNSLLNEFIKALIKY